MQTRSYDDNSVLLSVRLSVWQTYALWLNVRNICPDFYTMRKIIYNSFWQKMVGQPLLPEIMGQPTPVGAKSLILNRYSLVAPQP